MHTPPTYFTLPKRCHVVFYLHIRRARRLSVQYVQATGYKLSLKNNLHLKRCWAYHCPLTLIFNNFIKKLCLSYWAVDHINANAVNTRKKQPETCLITLQIILVYEFQIECVGKGREGGWSAFIFTLAHPDICLYSLCLKLALSPMYCTRLRLHLCIWGKTLRNVPAVPKQVHFALMLIIETYWVSHPSWPDRSEANSVVGASQFQVNRSVSLCFLLHFSSILWHSLPVNRLEATLSPSLCFWEMRLVYWLFL